MPLAQIEAMDWWQQSTLRGVPIVCTPTRHDWATFNLAYHDWDEPIRRTLAEARKTGVDPVTPRLGEWVSARGDFRSTP